MVMKRMGGRGVSWIRIQYREDIGKQSLCPVWQWKQRSWAAWCESDLHCALSLAKNRNCARGKQATSHWSHVTTGRKTSFQDCHCFDSFFYNPNFLIDILNNSKRDVKFPSVSKGAWVWKCWEHGFTDASQHEGNERVPGEGPHRINF